MGAPASRRPAHGFTLIELMIVVAIIGILAAIAIPNFIRYQLKSKTTEVRTNMGGMKVSEESFRSTEDGYASGEANPGAGWATTKRPWIDANTCAGCTRTSLTQCTYFSCMGYKPAGEVYYNYQISVQQPGAGAGSEAEFAIGAVGDLDGDDKNASFAMESCNSFDCTKGGVLTPPAISVCPAGVVPLEVVDCTIGTY